MKERMIFWQALTPVHPGTGQDSSSVIDLPIAREAATKFPVIPASSLKGVLRDGRGLKPDAEYSPEELEAAQKARKTFGYAGRRRKPDTEEQEEISQAGDLTLTDARILFLPVRSYAGTFALITCPLVLQRLGRDQETLGLGERLEIPPVAQGDALLTASSQIQHGQQVILEDIDLEAKPGADGLASALSRTIFGDEEEYFIQRFALVHNNVFSYFSETGMEVIARVSLKPDSKTVKDGGLWYEEAIPAEAIFSGFALSKTGDFGELDKKHIQIGGKGSVGRGLLRRLGVTGNG